MESSSSGSSKACLNKPTSTFNHFTPTRPASAHTNPFRHFLKRPREEEQKLELNVKMETEDSIQVIPDGDGLNQPITIDSPLLLESGSLESSSSKFRSQEPPQQPAAHEALPLTRSLIKSPSPSDQERFQPLVTPQFNPISNALFMKSVSGPEFIDLTGSSSPFLPSVGAVAPVSPTIRSPEVIAESKRIAEKKREAAAAAKEREEKMVLGQKSLARFGHGTSTWKAATIRADGTVELVQWKMDQRCTPQQKDVLDAIRNGSNVFFTGPAGTGKSFLMSEIRGLLGSMKKAFQVTATTGIAALEIGGITLHGFTSLGLCNESIETLYGKIMDNKTIKEKWTRTQVLIIDEISMCPTDLFCRINILAKLIRKSHLAFGGMKLIISGDFFQLPPVPDEGRTCIRCGSKQKMRKIAPHLSYLPELSLPEGVAQPEQVLQCVDCNLEIYSHSFVFETPSWAELSFVTIELRQVFRQADLGFADTLNKVRFGFSDKAIIKSLTKNNSTASGYPGGILPTSLFCTNKKVESLNNDEFNKLKAPAFAFACSDQKGGNASQEDLRHLKNIPAAVKLLLKIETQVVLQHNLSLPLGLVNGSRGVVVGWKERGSEFESALGSKTEKKQKMETRAKDGFWNKQDELLPEVYFANGHQCVIGPHTWSIELSKTSSVSRTQIPLAHAWAITIHKSQGLSLDAVVVQLGGRCGPGQAYVALSRCRTAAGMKVFGLTSTTIQADSTVLKFHENIAFKRPFLSGIVPPVNPLSFVQFPNRFSNIGFGSLPAPMIRAPPAITAVSLTWEEHLELAIRGISEANLGQSKEDVENLFTTKMREKLLETEPCPPRINSSQLTPIRPESFFSPIPRPNLIPLVPSSSLRRGGPISEEEEADLKGMIASGDMDVDEFGVMNDIEVVGNENERKRTKIV